jgi:DNA polymerase-3 subunit gamma/tau
MDQVIRDGFEPDQFIQGLSEHMRDLLVCKDSRTIGLLDVSEGLKERYQHQAALTSKSILLTGLDILNQCDIALPRSKNKRLYTEIALSKINFAKRAIESDLSSGSSPEKKTKLVRENNPPSNISIEKEVKVKQKKTSNSPSPEVPIEKKQTSHSEPSLSKSNADSNEIEEVESLLTKSSDQSIAVVIESPQNQEAKSSIPKTERTDDAISSFQKPRGLDAIMASVKKEEAKLQEARKGLNQETLEKLWSGYTNSHSSPSTRAMLDMAKISLNGKTITVLVPSNHYKNMVLEEEALKELLREKLGTSDLMLNPVVDREAFPDIEVEKPKALLTTKERYKYLAEKHPPLVKLVEKLELKPDSGSHH